MSGDLALGVILGLLVGLAIGGAGFAWIRRRPESEASSARTPGTATEPSAVEPLGSPGVAEAVPIEVLSATVTAAVLTVDWSRVLWVAPTFEAVTGLQVETFRNDPTTFTDLVAVMDRRRLDLLAGDEPGRAIMEVRDLSTGDYRSLLCVIEPISGSGEPSFVLTIVDLQAADQRVVELQDSVQKLEQDLLQQQWLNTELSHDLRSPLNALLGSGQILEASRLEPRDRRAVERMSSAGLTLRWLIDSVLDIARLDAGGIEIKNEVVSAERQVIEVVNTITPLAAKRNVTITTDGTGSDDSLVHGDVVSIQRVLTNLVANAIKFTPPGGEIRLGTSRTAEKVRFKVRDSGPGISNLDQARLFKPFERLGADGDGVAGTGVGLVLSQRLTEAMGGTIGVESPPAGGSLFWFELPFAKEGAGVVTATHTTPTVLYIEDDPDNQDLLSDAFEVVEVSTYAATTATRGLEMIRSLQPTVVIADAHLPDMSTKNFFSKLGDAVSGTGTSVIVVSGSVDHADLSSFAGFITAVHDKPVDIDALVAEVVDLLGRRLRAPVASLEGPSA